MGSAFHRQGLHRRHRWRPAVLTGLVSAAGFFGAINQIATFATTPVFGEVALLLGGDRDAAPAPPGITGRFFKARCGRPSSRVKSAALVVRDRLALLSACRA